MKNVSIILILFSFLCCTKSKNNVDLSGQWKFKLDSTEVGLNEEWFNTNLPDDIGVPGSTEEFGYGVKTITPKAGEYMPIELFAYSPKVMPDGKPNVGRLTRVVSYEGKAWYQREITVPKEWKDKRVELFLERCRWETTVWVDDVKKSSDNSISTPHIHDLGVLKPGTHRLTICVDNTIKLPLGSWCSAITEDTQGNWNGIIGKVELSATDLVWIKYVQVFPESLRVEVGNSTGEEVQAAIQGQNFTISKDGSVINIPFENNKAPWDEFSPTLQKLTVKLSSGSYNDEKTVSYGTRIMGIKDKKFVMNGRSIYMRGPVDEAIHPLTGYPPMDKAYWHKIIGTCKDYGFNFLRFHSWCPPEAAFQVADELGFLFQVELPLWTMDVPHYGEHPERDAWIKEEFFRILNTYGNHPSFGFMAMGNESSGSLSELTIKGRKYDHRMLYRCENGNTKETGDFHETGERGVMGPQTDWDRWTVRTGWIEGQQGDDEIQTGAPVPTFSHEVGQWLMYPDFDQIKKYTGTLRPYNLEYYKELLAKNQMLDQNKAFAQASGKFSVLLYKDDIEGCLRTDPFGGLQVLEARDYPGQGTALVGWLDAFWDSKGLIEPDEFRRFCDKTVCLLRMPKRVYNASETFEASAEIAHYAAADINTQPSWNIKDEQGNIVASGNWPDMKLKTGQLNAIGKIATSFKDVSAPQRLIVTVSGAETSNDWNIWVYPNEQASAPEQVHIAYKYDNEAKEALANGESVLLFSNPTEGVIEPIRRFAPPQSDRELPRAQSGANSFPGSFMPTFWSMRLFNQSGTLGFLCDPKHPAFASFPTESHCDWQWADLLGNFSCSNSFKAAGAGKGFYERIRRNTGDVDGRAKAIILTETPADYRPILQIIDNYERNAKLGTIFETKVGKGKLLVCAMDLETDADKRPAARQLRQSLLGYAASDEFQPKFELSSEVLTRLLINE